MARYGSREMSAAQPAGAASANRGATSAAAARVARKASRYLGIVEEGQVARPGLIERGDVVDDAASVRSGGEGRAAPVRDLGQRRRAALRKEADLGQTSGSVRCDDGRVSP